MKAKFTTPQVPPGDETQFMHVAFSSDDDMLNFYLILNRFVNPVTYLMQRSDMERLEDLHRMLKQQAAFLTPMENHYFSGINELTRAFGMFMMNINISNTNRINTASLVGNHMQFIIHLASNMNHIKQMSHANYSHIQNVEYLIAKLQNAEQENSSLLQEPV